jgi:hypothetical protein
MTMDADERMPDAEINDHVDDLINWFRSKNITPKHAAPIVFRLLAEQFVAADRDVDNLNDVLAKASMYLAMEVSKALEHDFGPVDDPITKN